MEPNFSKSLILSTPIFNGSTAILQTNISSEIFSVSFSFTQFQNSCDGHFSTTSNKISGPVHHNFLLVSSNSAFLVEMFSGFSWHILPVFYRNIFSNCINSILNPTLLLLSNLQNPPNSYL